MYCLNKLVGYLTSPVVLAWMGVVAALLLAVLRRRRLARGALVLCVIWLWIWATPLMTRLVGSSLERPYLVDGRVPTISGYPPADAIQLHGGGMGVETNLSDLAEMWTSADRVWHAARLYKAGKATNVFVTCNADMQLLTDLGVPRTSINNESMARNTEEEAKWVGSRFKSEFEKGRDGSALGLELKTPTQRPKVLVVTSAWHMKRTLMMYAKYAPNVEAIPAPCDFENTMRVSGSFALSELLPSDEALLANRVSLHEWVGILGYRYLRK